MTTPFLSAAGWSNLGSAGALDAVVVTGTFAGNGANTILGVTVAHGLPVTPQWVGITTQGGFFGFQSAPADGTNIYLGFQQPLFVFGVGSSNGYRCLCIG